MTIYGYARVSTVTQAKDGNSLEAQKDALMRAGAREIYLDTATGANTKRPQFQTLLTNLKAGDTLVVTKLDRLARSTIDGCNIIQSLLTQGVKVHVLNMGLLENTPVGRMMVTVMFAMAEFERELIRERTAEGRRVAREKPGYREGRAPITEKLDPKTTAELIGRVKLKDMSATSAAKALGVSRQTFYNLMDRYTAAVKGADDPWWNF